MIKRKIKQQKANEYKKLYDQVNLEISVDKKKLMEINSEKGASIWLSTIPLKDEGFNLDKQSFWDLIKIRYGHQVDRLPERCACGATFNLQHSLSCKKGGFITLRHNNLRDSTARLLAEVCKDVKVEPLLTPLTGEPSSGSANQSDEARLDVSAIGFWVSGQKAFFDKRVFNPIAGPY